MSLWCTNVWLKLYECLIYLQRALVSINAFCGEINYPWCLCVSVPNYELHLLSPHFASRPRQQVTPWPLRVCPPVGKRGRMQREELTMSTTTTVPPHGRGQSCRYITLPAWHYEMGLFFPTWMSSSETIGGKNLNPRYNLKSAVPTNSWLKTEPAPQPQHRVELRQWYLLPPLLPLPMPPTTTSMSPKSDDLVASAPPLSPFPVPWRWELATHPIPLHTILQSSTFSLFLVFYLILQGFQSFLLRRWTGHSSPVTTSHHSWGFSCKVIFIFQQVFHLICAYAVEFATFLLLCLLFLFFILLLLIVIIIPFILLMSNEPNLGTTSIINY